MTKIKTAREYIEQRAEWKDALEQLRAIIAETGLEESIKWGAPVYTFKGKNIVGLGAFKSYVGLWFFQGGLLSDPEQKLINAQEGKTKALRQWRFRSASEIDAGLVKSYVFEAIENQKQGKEIKADRNKELIIPEELQGLFGENPQTEVAFQQLSPGKQREYAEYIREAKQAATRQKRLEKITPMLLAGQGLNDRYKG